ncbi:hypothetical protein [Burkholderia cepacia]|uniref:hypothetical protein n=1 Tax=Burkholderia cepacia TaxID=292 RepID=UPI000AAC8A56|nr:hypothetical protein [Burkholderia cepacia]
METGGRTRRDQANQEASMVHDHHTMNPPSTAIARRAMKRAAGAHSRVIVFAMWR